jgi:hypothetical protein
LTSRVTVHSHTDNIGGLIYNKWLREVTSKMTILGRSNLAFIPESIEIRNF